MLDLFPDARWQYVAVINGVAVLFFLVMYAPWLIAERRKAASPSTTA